LRVAGIILAGGLARRLGGGDKTLRLLAGRPMFEHVMARVRPQVSVLALNANGDATRFAQWDLPVIADSIPGNPGPLAGVLAGLDWARSHASAPSDLLSIPGDTPFLPDDLVARLVAARTAGSADIAIAASAGRSHPVVALWRTELAESLRRAMLREGLRKVESFVARCHAVVVEYPAVPIDPFLNINREDDLLAAAAHIEREAAGRR
jgi:molybdopterin-guanine dinucleotide biosynthesis protein A